jgi:hypothetical protein
MMGQMENVGKVQQKQDNQNLNQQQSTGIVIHKQTDESTHDVTNLQHTDNLDKKINPDNEKKNQSFRQKQQEKKKRDELNASAVLLKDPDKGNIIDVKK